MKRLMIGILAAAVLLLATIIILPIFFREDVVTLIKDEASRDINATMDFGDFDMSIISRFPDFSFSLEDMSIVGIDEFEGDTLVSVGELSVTVDIMSLINRGDIVVKEIRVDRLNALAMVLEDGSVNWDIERQGTETKEAAVDTAAMAPFRMSLDRFLINDSKIKYDNRQDGTLAEMKGFDFSLSGDFTQDLTTLDSKTTISSVTLVMDTTRYLNEAEIAFNASVEADLANSVYTLKNNEFRLNQLLLEWNGSVSMPDDEVRLDIRFNAGKTEFKDILSLIPAVYSRDYDDIKTTGTLTLDGYARGSYSEGNLPAFGVKLLVEDATLQYPELPKSAEKIGINLSITNPGGNFDKTIINMSRLQAEVAGNPIEIRLVVKTPESDPEIHCKVKGKLNLTKLSDVIPLEEEEAISGFISSDITLQGRMSALEDERYDEFQAVGKVDIRGMNYTTPAMPRKVEIQEARLELSPRYLDVASFRGRIGRSDFAVKGRVENFIPYAVTDGAILKGNCDLKSGFLDLNELLSDSVAETAVTGEDTGPATAVDIPRNVEMTVTAGFDEIAYEEMTIKNASGRLKIKEKAMRIEDFRMDLLGGKATANGTYVTSKSESPKVNLDIDISNMEIPLAFKAFNTVQLLAPIGENSSGTFSSQFNVACTIDRDMDPVLTSLSGSGKLQTGRTVIKNSETINKLADTLKNKRFRKFEFNNLDLSFSLADGRVFIQPFDLTVGGSKARISGSNGFDQSLDYRMKMEIPTAEFGGSFDSFLGSASSMLSRTGLDINTAAMAEAVKLDLIIGGSTSRPTVRIGSLNLIGSSGKGLKEQLSEQMREEASRLIREAGLQADKVREEAQKAADRLRKEGYAQADKLEGEATNPIAKIAAGAAAGKLRDETDRKADRIIRDADRKAQQIVDDATRKAQGSGE